MKQMTLLLNVECEIDQLFDICRLGQPSPNPMRLQVQSIIPDSLGNAIVVLTGTQEDLEEVLEQYVAEMNSTMDFERPNYPITELTEETK